MLKKYTIKSSICQWYYGTSGGKVKVNSKIELYDFKPVCGIYKIENKETGRMYIGQSIHIPFRVGTHTKDLAKGKHNNKPLLEDFQKYGFKGFTVEILEECERFDLLEREFYYMIKYKNNLYNTGRTRILEEQYMSPIQKRGW